MNQARFIAAAVDSVLSQDYQHLELIVIDGGSADSTQGWLARQQAQDARLRWLSEPDSGPANAVNKALRMSRGTLIGWLNSDDLYTAGAVSRAVQALLGNPGLLMVYGHAEHVDAAGRVLGRYPTVAPPPPMTQFAQGCFVCQPTVFFKRAMHVLLGPLDESLKTAFDFEYWLRAFSAFVGRVGFVDAVQAQSRLHADCITLRMRRTVILEGMQLLARHLGGAPKEWLLTYANELLAAPTDAGDPDLRAHVYETVAVAKQWLRQDELAELELRLKSLLL
jgi:glycosyltransferase involved in cell wall biosynthesis